MGCIDVLQVIVANKNIIYNKKNKPSKQTWTLEKTIQNYLKASKTAGVSLKHHGPRPSRHENASDLEDLEGLQRVAAEKVQVQCGVHDGQVGNFSMAGHWDSEWD